MQVCGSTVSRPLMRCSGANRRSMTTGTPVCGLTAAENDCSADCSACG